MLIAWEFLYLPYSRFGHSSSLQSTHTSHQLISRYVKRSSDNPLLEHQVLAPMSLEQQYMSSSSAFENPFMPVRGVHGDSADTNCASFAADYNDFKLTHDELEMVRLCAEAATTTGSIANESILQATFDASTMPTLSRTSFSTEAHSQEDSVVSSGGEDILAG